MTTSASPWDEWVEPFAEWTPFLGTVDAEAYAGLLAQNPGYSVELGCGDGRVTSVVRPDYAIDISAEAIRRADERLDGSTSLGVDDIRSYKSPQPASFTYCAQNTLNLFADAEPIRQALNQIYGNTAPGGLFAFDVMNPDPQYLRRRNRYLQLRFKSNRHALYTGFARRSDYEFETFGIWETLDSGGVVLERKHLPSVDVTLRAETHYRDLLTAAGFHVVSVWGDYAGAHFDADSPIQLWLVRRPESV